MPIYINTEKNPYSITSYNLYFHPFEEMYKCRNDYSHQFYLYTWCTIVAVGGFYILAFLVGVILDVSIVSYIIRG